MIRYRGIIFVLFSLLLFGSFLSSSPQSALSVKEIIEKNIHAAGGKEKLAEVKTYSFKVGPTAIYLASTGEMKIVKGKEPVVTEVISVDQDKVKRNCFNTITELSGLQKSMYLSLARLRSGLFTLEKFKDHLEFKGLKSFGPKKHYMMSTNVGDLQVEFYLDSENFTLKRLVFKGFDQSQGRYEVNHDMGPYQDINGLKVPSSWFSSQVGTRGRNYEISDVQINQTLDKNFFSKLEINAGKVEASSGSLKGNVINFTVRGKNLIINTNWTAQCIQDAGFKTNDKLLLKIEDMESELQFYKTSDEMPQRSTFSGGARIMFLDNSRGETYLIYFYEVDFSQLKDILKPLLPIQVKKI